MRRAGVSGKHVVRMVVILAMVAVGLVTTAPEATASVVITPGVVHAAVRYDENAGNVADIVVCAQFDQPVAFIEADISFDSQPGNSPGAVVFGPRGGKTSHWCGTGVVPVLKPGFYAVGVDWSAHNGNGLSMGHAVGSGSFTVDPPPPVDKKTPDQADFWNRASALLWIAASVATLAACILSAGAAAPAAAAFFGGFAAGLGADAGYSSLLALDPPDPDYKTTVTATPLPLSAPPPDSLPNDAARKATADWFALVRDEAGQGNAMLRALYKAQGAAQAHDASWEQKQTLATAGFAHAYAADLRQQPALLAQLRPILADLGVPNFPITTQQLIDSQGAWDDGDVDPSLTKALTFGGSKPDDALHIGALIDTADPSVDTSVGLLDLVTGTGPAAKLVPSYSAEATQYDAWADQLQAHPVGNLPQGASQPAAITAIVPDSGPAAGASHVSVVGVGLQDTNEIDFGGTPAVSGSCGESECDVASPSGTGTVDVTAVSDAGRSATSPADRYTYVTGTPGPVKLPAGQLLEGGGFEPPGLAQIGSFETIEPANAADLGPWHLASGSVDLVGPDSAQAAEGVQFVDLNGNSDAGPGTLTQAAATIPGHVYQLAFQLAGNPNGDPAIKTLTATVGSTSTDFSFDTTGQGDESLGWTAEHLTTVACATTTHVTLSSTTEGIRGPLIDAVSLVDMGAAPAGSCTSTNHAPTATPQVIDATAGATRTVTLSGSDPDGDSLSYYVTQEPAHGSLSGDGAHWSYRAQPTFTGTDSLTFTVSDGQLTSTPANVTIHVTPTSTSPHRDVLITRASHSWARRIAVRRVDTQAPRELLLAFVTAERLHHADEHPPRIDGVRGAHLAWHRVARDRHGHRDVEIWRGYAARTLRDAAVHVRTDRPARLVLTVATFSAAAAVPGARAARHRLTGRAHLILRRCTDGSEVWAAGLVASPTVRATPGTRLTVRPSTAHHTSWVQRTGRVTTHTVRIGLDRPRHRGWAMAAVEVRPAG